MRVIKCLALLAAIAGAGFLLASPSSSSASAAEPLKPSEAPCSCPIPQSPQNFWPRPKLAEGRPALDEDDEIATLEAIGLALSEVGDGATYVWHHRNGHLSGIVQPSASFKDVTGKVCRHLVLILAAGRHSGRVEGIACRLPDGRWQLDG